MHQSGSPPCIGNVTNDGGHWLAGGGAVLADGYGYVALCRSDGEAFTTAAAGRSLAVPSGADRAGPPTTPHEPPTSGGDLAGWTVVDFGTPRERRMSDASLLAWTVVGLVTALAVHFFFQFVEIMSYDTLWSFQKPRRGRQVLRAPT
jgi:hypothetical protein